MQNKEQDLKKRIKELSDNLLYHQELYYLKSKPEISDEEYDGLFDELVELEKSYPQYAYEDSPTKRVGSDLDHELTTVEHTIPVLSLDKCYSSDELIKWIEKVEKSLQNPFGIVMEEKLDGASIVLYYEKGILKRAVTRGNGKVGNDVTDNVKTIRSVPLRIKEKIDIVVRGEIFIKKEKFRIYNKESGGIYANPRNLAAGVLRSVKSSSVAKVPLDVFIYEGYFENDKMSHIEILDYMKKLGFKTNNSVGFFANEITQDKRKILQDLKFYTDELYNVEKYIGLKTNQRSKLSYEIDGLVIKINELEIREKLGYTSHHPRWAIAYKFNSPQAITKLTDIIVQVGRNGRITPVAILKPVKLAGSTITRATLHNQEYIEQLDLSIGDTVSISKRGDVIPAVDEVLEKNTEQDSNWLMPERCPSCDKKLEKIGAHIFCVNKNCKDREIGSLVHFAGKSGLDIEGLGEKTIKFLYNNGFIKKFSDLYSFDYNRLENEEGFGIKKIENINTNLAKSKNKPFVTVLAAMGFENLGRRSIELLVDNGFETIDKIIDSANRDDWQLFSEVEGIGEIIGKIIVKEFSDEDNLEQIEKLKSVGFKFSKTENSTDYFINNNMDGQIWCVTGSFEHFKPRELAIEEIKKRGGRITNSVSSKTDYLLAGERAGSKLEKASKLGIKIIDEKKFLKMIE